MNDCIIAFIKYFIIFEIWTTNAVFDGVPVVIYKPENYSPGGVSMMYFHGGGFVIMSPGTLSLYLIIHCIYSTEIQYLRDRYGIVQKYKLLRLMMKWLLTLFLLFQITFPIPLKVRELWGQTLYWEFFCCIVFSLC